MADSKKVDQSGGCGGCGGDCGGGRSENANRKNAAFGDEAAPQAWGAGIAEVAVARMAANDGNAKRDGGLTSLKITDEDIDGFIEECDRQGRNPLDVVKFVADENGIDLSGDAKIAYGGDKAMIRDLLVGVLKRIVLGFVSYVSDKYGLGVIQAAVDALSKRSANTAGQDPGCRIVRVLPVGFCYAFKW